MKNNSFRKCLVFVIMLLFIVVATVPFSSAEKLKGKEQILTIWMPGITEDDYSTQMEISEGELQIFNDKLNAFLDVVGAAMSIISPGGVAITEGEWNQIKDNVNDFINSIRALDVNFPDVDTEQLVANTIDDLLHPFGNTFRPTPMFSVGKGFTWIPFYNHEAFAGMMLRPMFTSYLIGFSGLFKFHLFLPSFEKYLVIGMHRVRSIGFTGLFISFGDVSIDRILGPVLYVGTAYVRI